MVNKRETICEELSILPGTAYLQLAIATRILIHFSEHTFSMLENYFIQDERDDKTFLHVGRTSETSVGSLFTCITFSFCLHLFFFQIVHLHSSKFKRY